MSRLQLLLKGCSHVELRLLVAHGVSDGWVIQCYIHHRIETQRTSPPIDVPSWALGTNRGRPKRGTAPDCTRGVWVYRYASAWRSSVPCSFWQVWEGQLTAAQRDAITAFLNRLKYDAVAHVDEVGRCRTCMRGRRAVVGLHQHH